MNAFNNHLEKQSDMPLCLRDALTGSPLLNRHHEANMPVPVIIALTAD